MIIPPRRHQHPSSSANRPSYVAVTVNFNAEFNMIPVNPIIECFSGVLIPEYCQGLEASAVSTVHPFFVESLQGHSNRSLPRLPLHMHAEDIIPTFLTLNIYIGQCLPEALTITLLLLNEMFEVIRIVRISHSVGLLGIPKLHLISDTFPCWLARGIPLMERGPYPLQSKVRTTPPYLW
jgi:hypothetical protein